MMRNEVSKSMDRFRQEQARTPLTVQQRQQILEEVLPDLLPRVQEALQDSLLVPLPGTATLETGHIQLLANQVESLLRERLLGPLGSTIWPPPVSDPMPTTGGWISANSPVVWAI